MKRVAVLSAIILIVLLLAPLFVQVAAAFVGSGSSAAEQTGIYPYPYPKPIRFPIVFRDWVVPTPRPYPYP